MIVILLLLILFACSFVDSNGISYLDGCIKEVFVGG